MKMATRQQELRVSECVHARAHRDRIYWATRAQPALTKSQLLEDDTHLGSAIPVGSLL